MAIRKRSQASTNSKPPSLSLSARRSSTTRKLKQYRWSRFGARLSQLACSAIVCFFIKAQNAIFVDQLSIQSQLLFSLVLNVISALSAIGFLILYLTSFSASASKARLWMFIETFTDLIMFLLLTISIVLEGVKINGRCSIEATGHCNNLNLLMICQGFGIITWFAAFVIDCYAWLSVSRVEDTTTSPVSIKSLIRK